MGPSSCGNDHDNTFDSIRHTAEEITETLSQWLWMEVGGGGGGGGWRYVGSRYVMHETVCGTSTLNATNMYSS